MELLYIMLILLLVTRLFGEVAVRFGQPVLVGELLSGVCLGILIGNFRGSFPILSNLQHDEVFIAITDLAIFFLMLLAGIEMRPKDISRSSGTAIWVAVGGMLVPFTLGLALGLASLPTSDWKPAQMLYLGVALSVTAVPITMATLMELDKHRSHIGAVIVSAAVFDDLFSLFLLAILTSVLETGSGFSLGSLLLLGGKVVLFFVITVTVGRYGFPLLGALTRCLRVKYIEFSTVVGWALAFSLLAEWLDMHFILGAYAAGLFFTKQTVDEVVHKDLYLQIKAITLGFFAPIFFASIGLNIDLDALSAIPGFLVALLASAFLGKLIGAGGASYLSGLSSTESLAVGVGMNARGAVELIIADIALRAGLFSHPAPPPPVVDNLFSAIVLMAIAAALFSPMGLRVLLART